MATRTAITTRTATTTANTPQANLNPKFNDDNPNEFMDVDATPTLTPTLTHNPINSTTKPHHHLTATTFSPAYRSPYIFTPSNAHLPPLLPHLNCSYLSTPGIPPSLIQLKQHAQALCILIKHITLSSRSVVVDIKGSLDESENGNGEFTDIYLGGVESVEGETWDFLADLGTVYTGPDVGVKGEGVRRRHESPLTGLGNVLVQDQNKGEIREICPLHQLSASQLLEHENASALPYATHQSLISHANALLELIDHEYAAKGGLLSILPPQHEVEDRKKAESTLLGQYILYTQRLVSRLHELEREYANALDVIAGEAKVPAQMLSRLGPAGRKGRELVFPQDRFVLVNAGDDVCDFLERELAEKERVDEVVRQGYLREGVMGESLWEGSQGGKDFCKGITAVDVTTRYFRLRRDPLKTIFIVPAHSLHPGVRATVEMEKVPTVVSVVRPVWPERRSLWEQKQRKDMEELKGLRRVVEDLRVDVRYGEEEKRLLRYDNDLKDGEVRLLRRKVDELTVIVSADEASEGMKRFYRDWNSIGEREEGVKRGEARLAEEGVRVEKAKRDVERLRRQTEQDREDSRMRLNRVETNREKEFQSRIEALEAMDREAAFGAVELERKLKDVLGEQVKEVQVILEWLRNRKVGVEKDLVDDETVERGIRIGGEVVEGVGSSFGGGGYDYRDIDVDSSDDDVGGEGGVSRGPR